METTRVKVRKHKNVTVITIPKWIVDTLGLQVGNYLKITCDNNSKIILEKEVSE